MEEGHNVFLTGEAGTGKSYLLKEFIKKSRDNNKYVLVTAPSGIAAINVQGQTLHSKFKAPWEVCTESDDERPKQWVIDSDIIVIDEISMCRIDLFEFVMRNIARAEKEKGNKKQIIVVGDFAQLPPVVVGDNDINMLKKLYPDSNMYFAFESLLWQELSLNTVYLKEIMRQSDPEFTKQLNIARLADKSCVRPFNEYMYERYQKMNKQELQRLNIDLRQGFINGIALCSRKDTAKKINDNAIKNLKGKAKIFSADVKKKYPKSLFPTDKELKIINGMRVMALKNSDFCQNGSLGTVTAVYENGVNVSFDNGNDCYIEKYTWENTESKLVKEGKKQFKKKQTVGWFTQLPLRPAYAITIHKSQGQTFDKVNLWPSSWASGQLYVALSRVRSANDLFLMKKIKDEDLVCAEEVKDFINNLR